MNNPRTNIVMMGQQKGICHICDQEKTLVAFDKTSNLPVCREDLLPLVEADAWPARSPSRHHRPNPELHPKPMSNDQDDIVIRSLKQRWFALAKTEHIGHTPEITKEIDNVEQAIRELQRKAAQSASATRTR